MKSKFSGMILSSQEYSKKVKSAEQTDSSTSGQGMKTKHPLLIYLKQLYPYEDYAYNKYIMFIECKYLLSSHNLI